MLHSYIIYNDTILKDIVKNEVVKVKVTKNGMRFKLFFSFIYRLNAKKSSPKAKKNLTIS